MASGYTISTQRERGNGAGTHGHMADPQDRMHPEHQQLVAIIQESICTDCQEIGCGTNAVVYRGKHMRAGRAVATKFSKITGDINDTSSTHRRANLDRVESIIREIKIHKDLQHPNILQYITGYYNTGIAGCIVTELALPLNLSQVMRSTCHMMSEARFFDISRDMLRAVIYLHQQGLMHLDIKPENIMLIGKSQDDSRAVLGDFGHAHCVGSILTTWRDTEMFYVLQGQPTMITAKADMWGLGMTMMNLISGDIQILPTFLQISWRDLARAPNHPRLLTVQEASKRVLQILTSIFDSPGTYTHHFRDSAKNFIFRCVQVDPNLRMSSQDAQGHLWMKEKTVHYVGLSSSE